MTDEFPGSWCKVWRQLWTHRDIPFRDSLARFVLVTFLPTSLMSES